MLNPYAINNGTDNYFDANLNENYVIAPLTGPTQFPALAFDGFIQFNNGETTVHLPTSQKDQQFYENQLNLFNAKPKQFSDLKVLIEKNKPRKGFLFRIFKS